jgi:iron-sulfur cluster repair protein YtfE (RIC family)
LVNDDSSEGFIGRLTSEHHEILAVCESLELALAKGKHGELRDGFGYLEKLIQAHRMDEDGVLLPYLDDHYSGDEKVTRQLENVRRARDQLRRRCDTFADKLEWMAVNAGFTKAELQVDLEQIGKGLVELMEREESELFPLYGILEALDDGSLDNGELLVD